MATLFTKIIDGDIPAHFVWQDERCVAFLVIDPLTDGHAVVVPREEVDHWLDASSQLLTHLIQVAQTIGKAQHTEWNSARVGVLVQGFEVPHLHVHVWPVNGVEDFDLRNVTQGQDQDVLARNADRLRGRLRDQGHSDFVPA